MQESLEGIHFEKEGDIEQGKKLTEKEKKIFAGTNEGKVLSVLSEELLISAGQIKQKAGVDWRVAGLAINNLIEGGVIEAQKKMGTILVKAIHPERSKEILIKTRLYEIAELIKKNPGLIHSQISRKLNLDSKTVKKGITYLENSSLVIGVEGKRKAKFFFLAEYPKDASLKIMKAKNK